MIVCFRFIHRIIVVMGSMIIGGFMVINIGIVTPGMLVGVFTDASVDMIFQILDSLANQVLSS